MASIFTPRAFILYKLDLLVYVCFDLLLKFFFFKKIFCCEEIDQKLLFLFYLTLFAWQIFFGCYKSGA